MSEQPRNRFAARLEKLKNERSTWVPQWREISEYIDPTGFRWERTIRNDGRKRDQKIINSTATMALYRMRSGIMGGFTNQSQPWFKLSITDKKVASRKAVKTYLEDCTEVMMSVFERSNIYNTLHAAYGQLGAYGVSAILIEEDETDDIRAELLPVGSYCLAQNSEGVVDTCYREFCMTIRQLVQKFGEDNLTPQSKAAYKQGSLDSWVTVIHCIEPREDRNFESKTAKNMKFASIYVEKGAQEGLFLRESGYKEFPIMCPRWDRIGDDVYSKSPASIALGDIKMLQKLEERKLEAIAKLVNPPMKVVGDITDTKFSLQPGAITRVPTSAGDSGFSPVYTINPDINAISAEIQRCEQRIKQAFFEDLFMIISNLDNVRTATEIVERKAEKILMLGPVTGSLEKDLANPLISRAFGILESRGKLPEPPPELLREDGSSFVKEDLRPVYESMLASGQKSQAVGHVEMFMNLIGPIIGANPDSQLRIDFDELVKEIAMKTGVTARAIRDDDETGNLRAAREKQMQQAQAMEAMQQGAQGAKLLSEAQIQDGNALGMLLGQQGMRGA